MFVDHLLLVLLAEFSLAANPVHACDGDCDGDQMVAVSELVKGVSIALGTADLATCPPVDANGSGEVTVGELVLAVNNALEGCSAGNPTVTPRPTRTATPVVNICNDPFGNTPQLCGFSLAPSAIPAPQPIKTVRLTISIADLDGGINALCYGIAAVPTTPDPSTCRAIQLAGIPVDGVAMFDLTLPALTIRTYAIAVFVRDTSGNRSNVVTTTFRIV